MYNWKIELKLMLGYVAADLVNEIILIAICNSDYSLQSINIITKNSRSAILTNVPLNDRLVFENAVNELE